MVSKKNIGICRFEKAPYSRGGGGVDLPTYSSHLNLAVQGTDRSASLVKCQTARAEEKNR